MLDQSVIRNGFTYGGIGALGAFAIFLFLYFNGLNPFGYTLYVSVVFVAAFIFLGTASYKKYYNQNIGFLKALGVALTIAFFVGVISALLIWLFSKVAGQEALQMHIKEMKMLMQETEFKKKTIEVAGQANYEKSLLDVEKTTYLDLAIDDFVKKIGVGFFISIVAATFFRK